MKNENAELLSLENVQKLIIEECDAIKELLIEKNKQYGNSAVCPKRMFSNASPVEQIKVRIDDKLSRIQNFSADNDLSGDTEDAVKDLMGYLILLKVAERLYK